MEPKSMSPPVRQTSKYPCPACGSRYRRGDCCNICGVYAPVPAELDTSFSRKGKACKGRVWDKKAHKYVG